MTGLMPAVFFEDVVTPCAFAVHADGDVVVFEVYLHVYDTVSDARAGLRRYIDFYNQRRPRRALDGMTPEAVYFDSLPASLAA
jgi:transposase InsO family protein